MDDSVKEKLEAIWPEVIGLVITSHNGKTNVCPINYQGVSSTYEQPLSVCIGLDNKNLTLETILATKEFVYAYPSREQLEDTIYCGTVSGRNTNKLEQTSFTFSPSEFVTPPLLDGAVINYECVVVHSYNAGAFTIVVGEIKKLHSSDKSHLDKVYSLGGRNYGVIKETETLKFGR